MILKILLLLLKLIGIALLAIIALLLLLVLTVLLVPIRYCVKVEHGGDIYADCRISWLLHLLNARISYIDKKFNIRVRLSFFTLYDNLKAKKQKVKLSRNKNKISNSDKIRKATAGKKETGKLRQEKITENTKKESFDKDSIYQESIDKEANNKKVSEISNNVPVEKIKLFDNSDRQIKMKAKPRFSFIEKIKGIFEKIKAFIQGIKNRLISIFNTASDIRAKLKLISDFLQDKANREGFSLTYSKIKRVLKHILPVKLKSTVRFGTGDPCSTGQALGAISILYSFYGDDNISITPDFENKVFEGKHYARGRISLITLLIIAYTLIKDERFKRLKRNFVLLKEAL